MIHYHKLYIFDVMFCRKFPMLESISLPEAPTEILHPADLSAQFTHRAPIDGVILD